MNYSDYADKGQTQVMTLLKEKLSAEQWREADDLTKIIMLKNSNHKDGNYLSLDVENLPVEFIKEIDRLWQTHSNYHFGFSVQKRILKYRNYSDFITNVGWHKGDLWLSYSDLCFSTAAPEGHLPYCGWNFWQAVYVGSSSSHSSSLHQTHSHRPHYHAPHRHNSGESSGGAGAAIGAAALAAAPWLIGAAVVGGAGYLIYREATKGERKRKERLEREEQERQEKQRRLEEENRVQKNIESLLCLL
ncbi:MAG TPA: GUN4 domain-containing protein [Nostocaceae cyanobacterium]|nr:GUN4 domain-containing protein [Nostocaceae cyanobacterium]